MSTCQKCSLNVRSQQLSVSCSACSRGFHASCVSINAGDISYMRENGQHWKCAECVADVRRRRSIDDAPALTRSGSTGSKSGSRSRPESGADDTAAIPVLGGGSPLPVTLEGLMQRLSHLEQSFGSQVCDLKDAIVTLQLQLQDQAKQNSDLLKELQRTRSVNESLEKRINGPEAALSRSAAGSSSPSPPTYSGVTQQAAVVIRPKDSNQANSRTKVDLLRSVNPVTSEVEVTGVRHISNGGLVVNCSSSDDASKLSSMARATLAESYDIREAPKLHPRIRIVGMTERHDSESLINFLKTQNSDLFANGQLSLVSIANVKKNKNIYQAVLQLDALAYKLSLRSNRVFVGYDCCTVYDALEVTRCFNCSGFHHISSKCRGRVACPRCAGEHSLEGCKSQTLKCINCFSVSKSLPGINFNHAAWDHDCPAYKKKLSSLKMDIFGPE